MSEELTTTVELTTDSTPKTLSDLKPKMKITGKVKRLELYGAFLDLGVGADALIHISQLGTEQINRVSDVLNVGDELTVWVDKVDPQRQQVMVTRIQPLAVDWTDLKEGQVYTGKITRLENYGAFVDIGAEREGLVHISELSHDFVKSPKEVVNVDDEVQVQVLGFSKRKRRIDLSMKALMEKPEPVAPVTISHRQQVEQPVEDYYEEEDDDLPTAMEIALRRAMGGRADFLGGKRNGRERRRHEKTRRQQEDILNRTLHLQK